MALNEVGSTGSALVPSLGDGVTAVPLADGPAVSTVRVTVAVGPQKPAESWVWT